MVRSLPREIMAASKSTVYAFRRTYCNYCSIMMDEEKCTIAWYMVMENLTGCKGKKGHKGQLENNPSYAKTKTSVGTLT
ncbi:hypothetical protein KIN20_020643 [Parelaphostrongylus tenuis]|uniref:Uncharacterized protein n=1 Tax=Parelaphostrongylus tenuis TaxID=148309 RepID=A0AAD5MRK2_PARTN|nr:hypothetical protein KIN20_020643 [Parelaphostrongylus tenuis]